MATIELTYGEIRNIGFALGRAWNEEKANIKLSGKNLFHLLKLKAEIDRLNTVINDAFMAIGQAHGGTINELGNMDIPKDQITEVNKELNEVAQEKETIDYTPIELREEDNMPVDLMEALLTFIDIK